MPKLAAPKTETVYRNAKPKLKPYLIADGSGLYLRVSPDGGKRWIFRYRYCGQAKIIALLSNAYPGMSVKTAREGARCFQEQLAHGDDPAALRKAKVENQQLEVERLRVDEESKSITFCVMAQGWMASRMSQCCAATQANVARYFEKAVFPFVGEIPIAEITAPQIRDVVKRVEQAEKIDLAHRILQRCGQVCRFAVSNGHAERDVTADLRGLLPPVRGGHFAAITDPKEFGGLLRDIDSYRGWYAVVYALKLLPLVFTRPSELRLAEWTEVDLELAQWDIPAGRMKMRNAHVVPLASQAVEILKELRTYSGDSQFLFPTPRQRGKPISNVALLNGLRRMGYGTGDVTAHGFRATARTLLDEYLRVKPAVIEAQLAHRVSDALGTAYNRTQHLEERREMMQQWADYLDTLKAQG